MLSIVNEIEDYLETLGNRKLKVAIMGCAVNGPGKHPKLILGLQAAETELCFLKKERLSAASNKKNIITELKKEIEAMISE